MVHRGADEKQDGDFEVIGMCRSNLGKVIKTAGEQDGAADHSCDFKIGQAFVIQHPVKLQKSDQSEHADQQPEQDLVTREHYQQSDCPKRDRADEPQNESGTRRDHVRPGLLQRRRHALHHVEGRRAAQAGASASKRMRMPPPLRDPP